MKGLPLASFRSRTFSPTRLAEVPALARMVPSVPSTKMSSWPLAKAPSRSLNAASACSGPLACR
ncbi:hypothetical protein SSTU70S_00274 [Stutzerimonas stutzeri]